MSKKRVFKKLTGAMKYRKWGLWEMDDTVIVELLRVDRDQYKKPKYVCRVLESNFDEWQENDIVALNSVGMLDKAVEDYNIEPGDQLEVIYKGMSEITGKHPNAGDDAHSMEIGHASDNMEETDNDNDDYDI